MNPSPILTTKRTYLLSPQELTFAQIRTLDSDPDVMRYIGTGETRTKEKSKSWLEAKHKDYSKHGFGLMPAYLKTDNTFIGWAGLIPLDNTAKIEVGYRFAKCHWGKGYATEITKTIVEYAKNQLGIDDLVAITDPANDASKHVLEKCGFKYMKESHHYGFEVSFFEIGT